MRKLEITEYIDDTKDKSVTVPKETYTHITFRNQAEATRKHVLAKRIRETFEAGEYSSDKELAFDLHNVLGISLSRAKELAHDWFFPLKG